MTRRRIAGLVAFSMLCVGAARVNAQSTIVMHTLAHVPAGSGATLADIADLTGPEADALAGLALLTPEQVKSGGAHVDLLGVRAAIQKSGRVNMGRLALSGSSCIVRADVAEAPAPVNAPPPLATATAATSVVAADSVRAQAEQRIAETLNATPNDLHITFDDHRGMLSMTATGRTVRIQPTSMGDQISLSIRVYQGDVQVADGSVRATVLVRRSVVITRQAIARGSSPAIEALDNQEQWLPPSVLPATSAQVANAVLRTRVEAGKVIMARDVEPPLVVQRGDIVNIDCLAGTVVVSTTARAKEPAREGDTIQFQSLNSKKTFAARVSGPGKAVLVSTDEKGRS